MLGRIDVRCAVALAAACVAALALAQPGSAHRAPTKSEAKAIQRAIVRGCEHLGEGIDCRGSRGIRVSTADPHYAIGRPRSIDGIVAYRAGLRKPQGRWRVVWEEVNDLVNLTCAEYRAGFPNAVIEDFRLIGFPGAWGAEPPVPCWR
jgi:hypothetical protein